MSDSGSGLKTCASCGAVGDPEDLSCSSCGARAQGEAGDTPETPATAPVAQAAQMSSPASALTATASPVEPPSSPAAPTPDQPPAKKRGVLIAAVVVLLLVIGSVVYLVTKGSSAASASPTALGQAVAVDFNSGNYSAVCGLTTPAGNSSCQSSLRSAGSSLAMVTFKNMKVVLVRTSGSKSLVFFRGQACKKNSDVCESLPAPGSMTSEAFNSAYNKAINGTNGTVVAGLVQQGGKWYISGNGFGG
jgi:hypothetical protein